MTENTIVRFDVACGDDVRLRYVRANFALM